MFKQIVILIYQKLISNRLQCFTNLWSSPSRERGISSGGLETSRDLVLSRLSRWGENPLVMTKIAIKDGFPIKDGDFPIKHEHNYRKSACIVAFPIKDGDVPQLFVKLPEVTLMIND